MGMSKDRRAHRRYWNGLVVLGTVVAGALATASALAEMDKGHRLLIERGLQVQANVVRHDVFHLDTLQAAHYTTVNWMWESAPSWLGTPPGQVQWGSWIGDEKSMPPRADEEPYLSQMVSLSLGDEWALNDDATRTRLIHWFEAVRPHYPHTILYHNNYGSQVGDAPLADFIHRAQPDLLCFDTYPWQSDYATRTPRPGPPTGWYGDLRRYRVHATRNGLPLGVYRQTFHAVQDYDQVVFRDPSPSELRLNTFAALAFGATFLSDFTYNTGASSLFTSPGGDSNPTPLYHELAQVNREVLNLGPTLVRLTPLAPRPDGGEPTTDILFLRGQHRNPDGTEAYHDLPVGFVPDPQSPAYSDWIYQRNDPWLVGWSWRNLGPKNDALPGDVIIAWFRTLDESFDGNAYHGEIYFLVVNGLTAIDGTAADCRQRISLDFKTDLEAVQVVNRQTGEVEDRPLTKLPGKKRLTLDLDGGTGELLKLRTGAPFVR